MSFKGIRMGYNGDWWNFTTSPEDKFCVEMDPITRPIGSFKEECVKAAEQIGDVYRGEQVHVLYSGGMDSEVILESLRLANVPVKAVCMKFMRGENHKEFIAAARYVVDNDIPHDFVDVDARTLASSEESKQIAREAQIPNYVITLSMYPLIMPQYKGRTWMTGYAEPRAKFVGGRWCVFVDEYEYSIFKFFLANKIRGLPSFFTWSTELYTSFFQSKFWQVIYPMCPFCSSKSVKDTDELRWLFYYQEMGLVPRYKDDYGSKVRSWIMDQKWDRSWFSPLRQFFNQVGVKS